MQMFLVGNEKRLGRCRMRIADCRRKKHLPVKWTMNNRESAIGFTLLELLVVLVLVGALSAVAFPSIGRGMATLKVKTSSREIAATLRLARSLAIKEQKVYWVGFNQDKNEIELASDDLQFQKSFTLPEGVSIKKVSVIGDPGNRTPENPYYFFSPNGLTEAFEVLIENNRGRGIKVIQDSLIRSPRIEEVEAESSMKATEG